MNMGPEIDGVPTGGRRYGQTRADDGRRYQPDRDMNMDESHLPMPNGAFASPARSPSSLAGSASGRERDRLMDREKRAGDHSRSRTRTNRNGSGQLRICKKCGEPLTGQFVRALGGTFHLDCFMCRVCNSSALR